MVVRWYFPHISRFPIFLSMTGVASYGLILHHIGFGWPARPELNDGNLQSKISISDCWLHISWYIHRCCLNPLNPNFSWFHSISTIANRATWHPNTRAQTLQRAGAAATEIPPGIWGATWLEKPAFVDDFPSYKPPFPDFQLPRLMKPDGKWDLVHSGCYFGVSGFLVTPPFYAYYIAINLAIDPR